MLWKSTCLLFLHTLAFVPSFHFHASFPTIFSPIFLSLVWAIWTPLKHDPWLRIFCYHISWSLISFHHSFHPLTRVSFPPFTMPRLSLVIGPNPFYPTFVKSIHFHPFYPTFIQSIHFYTFYPFICSTFNLIHPPLQSRSNHIPFF